MTINMFKGDHDFNLYMKCNINITGIIDEVNKKEAFRNSNSPII